MENIGDNKVIYQFREKDTGKLVKVVSATESNAEAEASIETKKKELEAVHGKLEVIKSEKLF